MTDSLLLINGSIRTMDPVLPLASAIAVSGERFQAVGSGSPLQAAGPDTHVVDLHGLCVLPGLVDCHIHLGSFARRQLELDLAGVESLERMLERVAQEVASTPPGTWIQGRGWNQELWPDRRFPCAGDLDRVAQRHPVALTAKSGHAIVANSLALQKAGISADTPDPRGGKIQRDAQGRPTGLLLEEALRLVREAIPTPDPEFMAAALRTAFQQAWQLGLTAAHDMAFDRNEDLAVFDACQRLRDRGQLGLRVVKYFRHETLDNALALGLRSGLGDQWLRVGGMKVLGDGALGTRTAAMLQPYVGETDNLGILIVEEDELRDVVRRATAGGLAVATHAIGDRTNRVVLDALEEAVAAHPASVARHRIEHVQLLHPDDVGRLAELGVVASMQPAHAVQDAEMVDRYWGERGALAYAWRSLADAGTVLAFGSDWPVEDLNPFLGIHAAVTRLCPGGYGGSQGWRPEQRLTLAEAIHAHTVGAAHAVGMESVVGSISAGMLADLVVLDRDIFAGEPDQLAETQVVGTMVGGKWMWGEWAAS